MYEPGVGTNIGIAHVGAIAAVLISLAQPDGRADATNKIIK